jgi:hypothetical protein
MLVVTNISSEFLPVFEGFTICCGGKHNEILVVAIR